MNKMLLLQTDYLTLDVSRDDYSYPESKEWSEFIWHNWQSELKLDFTVQCNWKIKRVRTVVKVVNEESGCSWSESVNWKYIENWEQIVAVFKVFSDLWYDVPSGDWLQEVIKKAMQTLFSS